MKRILFKIHTTLKEIMPYMAIVAIFLGILNLIYIRETQNDISYVESRIDDVKDDINNISTDYDNSDVITTIKRAHNNIVNEIEESERHIVSQMIIWGN